MDPTTKIADLIEPTLQDLGYELVRVTFTGGENPVLQVMAEKADGTMTIDGCEEVSHAVSAILDVEDPISDAYNLEVSSPGIDRPLTRLKDFEKWAGFEAKVELDEAVNGQRRYRGKLLGVEDENILVLDSAGEKWELPFSDLRKAKLVLTDELIAASQSSNKS
ncbi:ribosome maturation factor RimP [Sneathiella glossodoripedis]|uniref:ribosome maturation factor RimP n=1 Tax=Sneathiella glossodoripedis TaxID=418853 RepID=UPI0004713096|nr:ribosome maturation factor RimP [Sneathiella glossodoripedis]